MSRLARLSPGAMRARIIARDRAYYRDIISRYPFGRSQRSGRVRRRAHSQLRQRSYCLAGVNV